MFVFLVLSLLRLSADGVSGEPWSQVRLTVFRDPYSSSEQVTTCRVRADNLGGGSWSGHLLGFEVRAIGAGRAARARGRFGMTLEPYGHLETVVVVPGRHDRFEVQPLPQHEREEHDQSPRRRPGRHKKRPAGASR